MEGEKDLSIILFYLQAEKAKFIIFLIVFLCANAIFSFSQAMCHFNLLNEFFLLKA